MIPSGRAWIIPSHSDPRCRALSSPGREVVHFACASINKSPAITRKLAVNYLEVQDDDGHDR